VSGLLSQIAPFFTGGVFGALLLWIAQEVVRGRRDKKARARAARYLDMRFAVLFESYALDCANKIADNRLHRNSGGHTGLGTLKLPEALALPDSTYWEFLAHDLAERAMTFQNVARHADGAIEFVSWIDNDPSATAVAFDDQAGMMGTKAWELACDLRREYGVIPFRKENIGWDFVDTLGRAEQSAKERRVSTKTPVEA